MIRKFFIVFVISLMFGIPSFAKVTALTPIPSSMQEVIDIKQAVAKEDFKRALTLLDKYLKENPNDEQMYNNRGLVNRNLGNYNKALNDFNTAIKLDKNYYNAYYNRANLRLLQGNLKETGVTLAVMPVFDV